MARIDLQGVSKRFGEQTIIPGLDLRIEDGEFMVFVGPSGCGKSTLLRMIAGLEDTSEGAILFDGVRVNEVHTAERGAAMVFQSYALYPHMTVEDNLGFALRMAGRPRAERETLVRETAERLQLTPLLKRFPRQLSGGQRQRVAIGRAIVRRPKVFLFDEPLSNLDASLRVQMRIELARLHAELGTTMVYVTHDQTEAMTLGDRIAVFNQGRIEQVGDPMDLYRDPDNRFVAEFLGAPKINLLSYQLDEQSDRVRLADGLSAAAADLGCTTDQLRPGQTVGLRPESLTLTHAGTGLPACVEFTEHLGDTAVVYVRLPGRAELLAVKQSGADRPAAIGTTVGVLVQPASALVFGADGGRV
jgi:multiple sugar transport system ATP-binding protein